MSDNEQFKQLAAQGELSQEAAWESLQFSYGPLDGTAHEASGTTHFDGESIIVVHLGAATGRIVSTTVEIDREGGNARLSQKNGQNMTTLSVQEYGRHGGVKSDRPDQQQQDDFDFKLPKGELSGKDLMVLMAGVLDTMTQRMQHGAPGHDWSVDIF